MIDGGERRDPVFFHQTNMITLTFELADLRSMKRENLSPFSPPSLHSTLCNTISVYFTNQMAVGARNPNEPTRHLVREAGFLLTDLIIHSSC